MCVGAGNKSSRDPCLPQCWNEAVTRKRGTISARCGLISQGSWPGIERLCHCHTAAAATAGFYEKKKKKPQRQTNETKHEDLPTPPGTRVCERSSGLHQHNPRGQKSVVLGYLPGQCPQANLWGKDNETATGKKPARQKRWAKSPR